MTTQPENDTQTQDSEAVACIRFVRFWHRAWALYHKLKLHAACNRGDMLEAFTHAEKELRHIAKTPFVRKPNAEVSQAAVPASCLELVRKEKP